jgi:hypothetical protein
MAIEESDDVKGKAVKDFAKELACKDYVEQDYFDMVSPPIWNQFPVKLPPNAKSLTSDISSYWKKLLDQRLLSLEAPLNYSKIKIGYSPKTNFVFFTL